MNNKFLFIFLRYLFALILGINSLYFIYLIFEPLTLYVSYFILELFYNVEIVKETVTLIIKDYSIEIVEACVAGAAYYLLLILNLTTPMKIRKRINSLLFIIGGFFLLNIIRIIIFSILLINGFEYFDITHKVFWYVISTILVICVWFGNVYLFKIKEIPVYSDFKNIWREIKRSKKQCTTTA